MFIVFVHTALNIWVECKNHFKDLKASWGACDFFFFVLSITEAANHYFFLFQAKEQRKQAALDLLQWVHMEAAVHFGWMQNER